MNAFYISHLALSPMTTPQHSHYISKVLSVILLGGEKAFYLSISICNSYTTVRPPVRGDNPRALESGLSPVQADKPWYNFLLYHP